jgi:hypothetical protein
MVLWGLSECNSIHIRQTRPERPCTNDPSCICLDRRLRRPYDGNLVRRSTDRKVEQVAVPVLRDHVLDALGFQALMESGASRHLWNSGLAMRASASTRISAPAEETSDLCPRLLTSDGQQVAFAAVGSAYPTSASRKPSSIIIATRSTNALSLKLPGDRLDWRAAVKTLSTV